jgi:GGDEF domain-containing protein
MAYANSTQREQLRTQALTDELTGLFNRRHFEHSLSMVLRAERDRGGPTSVVYFDVDAFKAINDRSVWSARPTSTSGAPSARGATASCSGRAAAGC